MKIQSAKLLVIVFTLFLTACQPIMPQEAAMDSQPAAANVSTSADASVGPAVSPDAATATVTVRSLRVRQKPDGVSTVVAGIKQGESYKVAARSSDGQWLQLAIPGAPGGAGWVSTNFVSVEGSIIDAPIVESAKPAPAPTPEPVPAAAVTATEAAPLAAGFGRAVTDGTRLRVRAEPNAEAQIVGYIYNGETFQIVEQSADGLWTKIAGGTNDNPNGGWVATQFLTIGQ